MLIWINFCRKTGGFPRWATIEARVIEWKAADLPRQGIGMLTHFVQAHVVQWIADYGYLVLAVAIALESAGLPLPGETMLIASAAYAAATGGLDLGKIIAAAALGAVAGDNAGYEIGRRLGFPALVRWGGRFGLNPRKLMIARYLFALHGAKVVFFGRFVALLRMLAAALAGVNMMPRGTFFLFNLAGGVCWALLFGLGGYWAGDQIHRLSNWFGLVVLGAGLCGCVLLWLALRRQEAAWAEAAEHYFATRGEDVFSHGRPPKAGSPFDESGL